MLIIDLSSKWSGFPIYQAQSGSYGCCLVQTNPASGFAQDQIIAVAELGNVMGDSNGFTQWQEGTVTEIRDGRVFLDGP